MFRLDLAEKYRIQLPETMQESHMLESEDEAENEALTGDASYPFLTSDDIRIMPDDSAAPVASAPPNADTASDPVAEAAATAAAVMTTSGTSTIMGIMSICTFQSLD